MKCQPWIAAVLVGLGVASCGENAPPSTQSRVGLNSPDNVARATPPAQPQPKQDSAPVQTTAARKVVRNDAPIPPKDAMWTILCDSVAGPGHVENAGILKSRLVQFSGMSDWYVIHSDNESTIYYGYYRSLDIPAEKTRAERDRAKIATLTDRVGNRLVRGGVLVPANAPDPAAPPEWSLLNTPKNAYWTMEIATFANNERRKDAAVQMVRELREKDEPAYYYHGPSSSSVCIGAWPRDAIKEQGTGIDAKGNTRDDAHTPNADQSLFVFGGDKLPANISNNVRDPATGKQMAVEGMKLEIQSPDMKAEISKFPYHYVNYELHASESKGQTFPDPSVLVIIPREQAAGGEEDWRLSGGASPAGVQQPRAPSAAGDNVLRSIGDR